LTPAVEASQADLVEVALAQLEQWTKETTKHEECGALAPAAR